MHETLFLILGLAGLLTIASILLPIAQRLNFPYTVLLAVAGSVLGGIVLVVGDLEGLWLLGDFLKAIDQFDITSDLVFFVFLPTLIFESALNISVRHLLDEIGPILLLAVLGLLISTFVVGLSVWGVSGIPLVACLLLGAIVSATDPVAVVAIFKDLGAPKRLTILVEGESLFNDATAIVLFTILAGVLVGTSDTGLLHGTLDFFRVFLGGILVGLFWAWIVSSIIGQLHKMPLIEITLTVCLAYYVFLFAEHYLHVSGVMAVVAAAMTIRSFGRTQVSPATWHALTETWEQLGFWANSLIFFLVGLLVPKVLMDFATADFLILLVLILAAFGARALVLFGLLPQLGRLGFGQQVSAAYRTVMFWGGLRGAVSLALALVILESPDVAPELKTFIAVLVTGFVLFTLFVNAPTMPLVMKLLGMDNPPATEIAMRNRIMALSLANTTEQLEKAANEYRIDPAIAEKIAGDYRQRLETIHQALDKSGKLNDAQLLKVGLTTLSNQEREFYLQRFERGLVSPAVTRLLLHRADNLLDGVKTNGVEGYWQAVERNLGFDSTFRAGLYLHRRFGFNALLTYRLAKRFEVLRTMQAVVRDLAAYARENSRLLLGEAVSKELGQLLDRRYELTWEALKALRLQFPEYARMVQASHLGRAALRLEEADYRRMLDEQVLSQDAFNHLVKDLDQRARELDRLPKLDLGLDPAKLIAKVDLFADLDEARIHEITRLLRPRLAVPGERIMRKGELGDAMYFISSGAVEIRLEPKPVKLGSGDFFGAIALVTRQSRKMDAVALGYCQLLVLREKDFQSLLDEHPKLKEKITRTVEERLQSWFEADRPEQVATL